MHPDASARYQKRMITSCCFASGEQQTPPGGPDATTWNRNPLHPLARHERGTTGRGMVLGIVDAPPPYGAVTTTALHARPPLRR